MVQNFLRPLLVLLMVSFPAYAGDRFFSAIDDLPLMAGLEEVGGGVTFDTPQGRIAEATAQGRVAQDAVGAFYDRTLPQLGWAAAGKNRFAREGESLELRFENTGDALTVRFSLAPSGK